MTFHGKYTNPNPAVNSGLGPMLDGCMDEHSPASNPRCTHAPAGGTTPDGSRAPSVESGLEPTPPAGLPADHPDYREEWKP